MMVEGGCLTMLFLHADQTVQMLFVSLCILSQSNLQMAEDRDVIDLNENI